MYRENNSVMIDEHGMKGTVSSVNPVLRYTSNPILSPSHVNAIWKAPELQVVTVHNAGVTRFENKTAMLFRSHLRCGKSVIGLATSSNGIDNWDINPYPVLKWAHSEDVFATGVDKDEVIVSEAGGVEDPRIINMGDMYAVLYSAYSAQMKNRVRVHLAVTYDFVNYIRYGAVLEKDMRNVCLFSEPVNNSFAALFRPNDITTGDIGGIFTEIKIGFTKDWRKGNWEIVPSPLIRTGTGPSAFSDKIGPGAPPVKTPFGWLNLFHGVRTTMAGNPYVLGIALHDLSELTRVRMSSIPILFPTAADCRTGESEYIHVPQVVFSCGLIRNDNGVIYIYYGGNDTVMNLGITHESVLVDMCINYGQDPITGELLYKVGARG